MALQHTKLVSRALQTRKACLFLSHIQVRLESDGTGGGPYRPFPLEKYGWPKTAEHWLKEYPAQSSEKDEYPKEEVYLDEIEERMKKYDKKYHMSPRVKKLYNEFGWEDQDDRAFINYGGSLGDNGQYGRGKKIDPSHYINAQPVAVNRNVIPPVQFMTPEQVRRSRGRLASFREVPPETSSIWKYWNAYSCLGAAGAIILTKELYIIGGHDFFDALMLWTFFGGVMSVMGDWLAWWHTLRVQEGYDKEWMLLNRNVKKMHENLEELSRRPSERKLLTSLMYYRDYLSEKVLQKTLSNRLSRIIESTTRKLQDKITEEATTKREAENQWKRDALNWTLEYFKKDNIKKQFTKDALKQFTQENKAQLSNRALEVKMDYNEFEKKYHEFYEEAKTKFLNEHREKDSLSWVFRSNEERNPHILSKEQKQDEYKKRTTSWAKTHNPVHVSTTPSF